MSLLLMGILWRKGAGAPGSVLSCPASSPLLTGSPTFTVFSHLAPDTQCQCTELICMDLGSHILEFTCLLSLHTHFLLPCFPISLLPPIFPVQNHCWQYCNLWREAKHGSTGLPLGQHRIVKQSPLLALGIHRWLAELSSKPIGGSDAQELSYCQNATETLAGHTNGRTVV